APQLHPLPTRRSSDLFDMLPVLAGKEKSPRQEMFWQRRLDCAARVGPYKWVESAAGAGLFDLSADLSEQHDLSTERSAVLADLRSEEHTSELQSLAYL